MTAATFHYVKMFLFIIYALVVSVGFLKFNLHARRGKNWVFIHHFYESKQLEKHLVSIKVAL